ncbi:MAG: ATP-binding cassette domain-containing protein [Labilithrix sp.]|nr:ATP-binding cassette domain-containing protein [Labilithrix sp.]MCW5809943.1 ATP-binding cassette domain-containing protein [Labilithrix sp.]
MGRFFLAPEVVQISSMDCGVAAMACFLKGVGLAVSYERLREACHTDVDGTSIDALEDLGNQLGIDCIQHLLPPESVLEEASKRLPAIAVTVAAGDTTHFVVLWRRIGKYWNVMDPAHGRLWMHERSLFRWLKSHTQSFSPDDFVAWAMESSFTQGLLDRVTRLAGRQAAVQALASARSGTWRSIAALDAAARFIEGIVGTRRPSWTGALFQKALEAASDEGRAKEIPERFWSIREGPNGTVQLTGNILLANAAPVSPSSNGRLPAAGVPESLVRAVAEPEPSLWQMMRGLGGRSFPRLMSLIAALAALSGLVSLVEVLTVRASLSSSAFFSQVTQKVGLLVWLATLFGGLLAIECVTFLLLRRIGRRLETRLRIGLFESLPGLDDTFIRSRPTSDLAQRVQSIPGARELPSVLEGAFRSGVDLLFTVAAMATLDPWIAVMAVGSTVFSAIFAMIVRSKGEELENKVQSNEAGILHVMEDALLGSVPVRVHGAERALVREQRLRLIPWVTTQRERLVFHTATMLLEQGVTYLFIVAMLWRGVTAFSHGAGFLILMFWAVRLPAAAAGIISAVQVLPLYGVSLRRAMEPLRNAVAPPRESASPESRAGGVGLRFDDVRVMASGQPILDEVRLDIRPGEHIAVVGRSGAGKSTLISLLLGLHSPAAGKIYVDGEELTRARLERLRRQTAWLDPSVFLWNDTFLYNLSYGHPDAGFRSTQSALEVTDLVGVVERLPSGLMSSIGSSGMLLSGGEGQRLRLARGLLNPAPRLALLDEPFRGLDRSARARMMRTVRETFSRQTLLVVTHDVEHAEGFDRVLVIEDGRIKEDGVPAELLKRPSRFRDLFEADWHNQDRVWGGGRWRYVEVQSGVALVDNDADGTWTRR